MARNPLAQGPAVGGADAGAWLVRTELPAAQAPGSGPALLSPPGAEPRSPVVMREGTGMQCSREAQCWAHRGRLRPGNVASRDWLTAEPLTWVGFNSKYVCTQTVTELILPFPRI